MKEQNTELVEVEFLNNTRPHPVKYATRLAAEGSAYLVGPQFYFSFISALKIGATLTGAAYLALAAIYTSISGFHLGTFLRVFSGFPLTLLWVSAAILGVFVALEKSGERASWLDKWSAADLEQIDDNKPMSRGHTLFDLGIAVLALLWLVDIIQVPAFIDLESSSVSYWLIDLPDWFWIAVGVMLVFDIAQPDLLSIQGESADLSPDLLQMAKNAVRGMLGCVCAILAWDTVIHIWRLTR